MVPYRGQDPANIWPAITLQAASQIDGLMGDCNRVNAASPLSRQLPLVPGMRNRGNLADTHIARLPWFPLASIPIKCS